MHHPTDRIHTIAFLHQSWSTGWNEIQRKTETELVRKTEGGRRERDRRQRESEEMFYVTIHSTHFIYGYMASNGKGPFR